LLCDESLDDADHLPAPEIIAREIVEDLTTALGEFEVVAAALEATANGDADSTWIVSGHRRFGCQVAQC
jgi:type I restriction enzyme M protein